MFKDGIALGFKCIDVSLKQFSWKWFLRIVKSTYKSRSYIELNPILFTHTFNKYLLLNGKLYSFISLGALQLGTKQTDCLHCLKYKCTTMSFKT